MANVCLLAALLSSVCCLAASDGNARLSSVDAGFVYGIEGFATELECVLNTCLKKPTEVRWSKDGQVIFAGTRPQSDRITAERFFVKHLITFDHGYDCNGACADDEPCDDGQHCLENTCCHCESEEFTLTMHNLTLMDAGNYRCEYNDQMVEFDVEVLESGLPQNFHKNLTFDYTECCEDRGMDSKCRQMCQPGAIETHRFNPLECHAKLPDFLHCVTEGGNVSHIHCCRLQLVPPFCWDFCSGDVQHLRESHRLCLYWIPEILQCYERSYLPYPNPPDEVTVNSLDSDKLRVCWKAPSQRSADAHLRVSHFTVNYKEVPRFPFLGGPGGIPFLPDVDQDDVPPQRDEEFGFGRFERDTKLVDGRYEGEVKFRQKRQDFVFITHNTLTNETRVQEFRFEQKNTSDTCYTIDRLKSSTQYFVHVTASNDYGTSLPSVRAISATRAKVYPSGSMPPIEQCCRENDVDEMCVPKLCSVDRTPSTFGALDIALNCRTQFVGVAPCLADGRDHRPCCEASGVHGDCLGLCDGTAHFLGLSSVLCLTLDMYAVYSCLREGYVTHPSPPQNVTVTDIGAESAMLSWSPPAANADKVYSYSVFLLKQTPINNGFMETKNATSPHALYDLEPNYPYMVYVVAHTNHGSSLKSTIEEFFTETDERTVVCPIGRPLTNPDGRRFHCAPPPMRCPPSYDCHTDMATGETFCCQAAPTPDRPPSKLLPNVTQCCADRDVAAHCQRLCSYNTTVEDLLLYGPNCVRSIHHWVDCGADGRNHMPCCERAGVPQLCQVFCKPPLTRLNREHMRCIQFVDPIMRCGAEGILHLPGPPRHLEVLTLSHSSVTLTWLPPTQIPKVVHYQVRLFLDDELSKQVNVTSGQTVTFDGLEADKQYVTNAIAWNEHGSSIASNNVTFVPRAARPEEAKRPEAPHSLVEQWNRGVAVNITWSWSGKAVDGTPIKRFNFTLYYGRVVMDVPIKFSKVQTNRTWAVADNLPRHTQLDFYVTAKNVETGVESRPSENVMVVTVPDEAVRPNLPLISVEPQSDVYNAGQRVTVACNATDAPGARVTLHVGDRPPEVGDGRAQYTFEALSADDARAPIVCSYKTSTDNELTSRYRLDVQFPARPLSKGRVDSAVFAGMKANLTCEFESNPAASVSWHFKRTAADEELQLDSADVTLTTRLYTYQSVFTVDNAKDSDNGLFICRTCSMFKGEPLCKDKEFSLTVKALPLPKGPDELYACCEKQKVDPRCKAACQFDLDLSKYNNSVCLKELPKLLLCAKDGMDHGQCCTERAVPSDCLGLCDLRATDTPPHVDFAKCAEHAAKAIYCLEKAHQSIPGVPTNLRSKAVSKDTLRVEWDPPLHNADGVQLYALYYRPADNDKEGYRWNITSKTFFELPNLRDGTSYKLAVLSGNQYGFSQYARLDAVMSASLVESDAGGSSFSAGSLFGILLVVLVIAAVLLAVVLITRQNPHRMPTFLQKMTGSSRHGHDPSVAFENPGYDREGQVRGLPGQDALDDSAAYDLPDENWQSARLQPPSSAAAADDADDAAAAAAASPQKGMRYAKLT